MNDSELKTYLGLKIKYYRKKLNLTQDELGEKINRTQRQISLIELGNSFPAPETLINLTKVFDCTIKDLFDFEPIGKIKDIKSELLKNIDTLPDEKLKILYLISKNI